MDSEPEEWPAFASYLEDIKSLKEGFTRSEIIYVPRTQNSTADSLALSVRKQPSFVVHMDQYLPTASPSQYESVVDYKKKQKYSVLAGKCDFMGFSEKQKKLRFW